MVAFGEMLVGTALCVWILEFLHAAMPYDRIPLRLFWHGMARGERSMVAALVHRACLLDWWIEMILNEVCCITPDTHCLSTCFPSLMALTQFLCSSACDRGEIDVRPSPFPGALDSGF